jgi:hypothetical protein
MWRRRDRAASRRQNRRIGTQACPAGAAGENGLYVMPGGNGLTDIPKLLNGSGDCAGKWRQSRISSMSSDRRRRFDLPASPVAKRTPSFVTVL